jgi:hypothetical protein
VVRHYGCRAFGPEVLDPDDGPPETEVQTILPNHELPGGLLGAQGPPRLERDAALASRTPDVWMSFTHEDRAIPDLRAMPRPSVRARDHLAWRTCAYARWVQAGAGAPAVAGRASAPAAYRGNLDRVRSLVEAGADVTACDERFGATASDWAGWTKQEAVVAYLKSVVRRPRDALGPT